MGELTARRMHSVDPEFAGRLAKEMVHNFAYSAESAFVFAPFIDIIRGEASFTGQPTSPRNTDDAAGIPLAPERIAFPNTTVTARVLAGALDSLNQAVPFPMPTLTASEVDHIMRGMTGGGPIQILDAVEEAIGFNPKATEGMTKEARDVFILGKVFPRYKDSQSIRDFYEMRKTVKGYEQVASMFKDRKPTDDPGMVLNWMAQSRKFPKRALALTSRFLRKLNADYRVAPVPGDEQEGEKTKQDIGRMMDKFAKFGVQIMHHMEAGRSTRKSEAEGALETLRR